MVSFVVEALSREHARDGFNSGSEPLDRYLREAAFQDVKRFLSGCYAAVTPAGAVAAYYTLAATHILISALPSEMVRKLPRYPAIPAMLIGRLAVASSFQKKGLGRAMLVDAAMRIRGLGIGAYALVVDAKDEAAIAFYRANGFQPILCEERRLFMPLAKALKDLSPTEL